MAITESETSTRTVALNDAVAPDGEATPFPPEASLEIREPATGIYELSRHGETWTVELCFDGTAEVTLHDGESPTALFGWLERVIRHELDAREVTLVE